MNKFKITPSIYTCDTTKIFEEISNLIDAGIEQIHFDVMDGKFVPNYALGPKMIDDIKQYFPELIIDAHIMADNIENNLVQFKNADFITFHINSIQENGIENLIKKIKAMNKKVGIGFDLDSDISKLKDVIGEIDMVTLMSIKPGFAGQVFEEKTWETIRIINKEIKPLHPNLIVQIDGGVRWENILRIIKERIDLIVVGSLMFKEHDYKSVMQRIWELENMN